MPAFISQKIAHSTGLASAQALILQAISALHGRLTRACIARRALQSYSYAYNSYRKGKLQVYLIIKLSRLKVSGAHAPLGPTVDTPLDVAFIATCLPPTLSPYRSASGIGYASKKLSKMAGNPASYPVYSRYNQLL